MLCDICHSQMIEKNTTYVLDLNGQLIIVENVPAKVCNNCGEKLFLPEIVEQLQKIIWNQKQPLRVIQTPIYRFAS